MLITKKLYKEYRKVKRDRKTLLTHRHFPSSIFPPMHFLSLTSFVQSIFMAPICQATMLGQALSWNRIVLPNFISTFFTCHKTSPRYVFFTHLVRKIVFSCLLMWIVNYQSCYSLKSHENHCPFATYNKTTVILTQLISGGKHPWILTITIAFAYQILKISKYPLILSSTQEQTLGLL